MIKKNKRKIEMKLYEVLGIRLFQKMVFKLEKIVHLKDGSKNENYHFQRKRVHYSTHFIRYLFYNGSIHVRNMVYLFILYLIMHVCVKTSVLDLGIISLGIKDIYCIMLQRYNYLRITEYNDKRQERNQKRKNQKVEKLKANITEFYDKEKIQEDLAFVRRLKVEIATKHCVIVKEDDIEKMQRLSALYYGTAKKD